MFYPRFIKWLAKLPAPFALGILWWGEALVLISSLLGIHLLFGYIFSNISRDKEMYLFSMALFLYFFPLYLIHFTFGRVSLLMESLIDINRRGGISRIERIKSGMESVENSEDEEVFEPYKQPEKIRASAGPFKIRYFIILPTSILLYLLGFISTIYRIFDRQIFDWKWGSLAFPAILVVGIASFLYWRLLSCLPGYLSIRSIIGKPGGKEIE